MPKEKKKWETPKLICLYKGRPEEAVLQACKSQLETATGPKGNLCNPGQGQCSLWSAT